MKAIMKSIKPKTCANIMNLIQSILVIKNKREATAIQKLIDKNGFADIYVHCSKKGGNLLEMDFIEDNIRAKLEKDCDSEDLENSCDILNGKVLFKFRCYKIEEMTLPYTKFGTGEYVGCEEERKWQTSTMDEDEILKLSCLTEVELYGYLVGKNKGANAIHISKLEIFAEPKELCGFRKYYRSKGYPQNQSWYLTKAPQSWCYIEVGDE